MDVVESMHGQVKPLAVRLRDMWPTRTEWRRSWAPIFRGSILGFIIGLLPGARTVMASFASYRLEKAVSKYRNEIGEGAIEGVAGPETANNAAATSSMVPLLALGLPLGPVSALMYAAMLVHDVQPSPLLMTKNPEIFWGVIVSMYVGNVMLMILNVPLIGVWVSLLRVPHHIFLPVIVLLATIGSYSMNNSMLDVYLLLLFGIVGYVLRKFDFTLAPMVVGLVLGPMIEKHLREALYVSLGDISVFYTSPIAIVIWILVLIVVTLNMWRRLANKIIRHF